MVEPSNQSEESAALGGFSLFLESYIRSRLPTSFRRYVGVSDIFQSVLIIALQRGQHFRGDEKSKYRAWLLRIAERKIIDKMRRYRQRACPPRSQQDFGKEYAPLMDTRFPNQLVEEAEEARVLLVAIEKLPDEIQQIIVLRNVRALTFNQVASELNLPVTTCRRRWCEGLEMLAGDLDQVWQE